MNLQRQHIRILEYCAAPRFGHYTEWEPDLQELVDEGYMIGNWSGSVEYSPYPVWNITRDGEQAFKEYKRVQLVASTKQCTTRCTYAYGEEAYLVAYCTVCGRQIKK